MTSSGSLSALGGHSKTYRAHACHYCRLKKVKCFGGQPCEQCLDHHQECIFPARRRPRRRAGSSHDTVAQRLHRLESMMASASGSAHSSTNDPPSTSIVSSSVAYCPPQPSIIMQSEAGIQDVSSREPLTTITFPVLPQAAQNNLTSLMTTEPTQNESPQEVMQQDESGLPSQQPTALQFNISEFVSPNTRRRRSISTTNGSTEILRCPDQTPDDMPQSGTNGAEQPQFDRHEDRSLGSDEISNWEYNGPTSYLSICSQPGLTWVTSKVRAPGVGESILQFARDVTRRLKMESLSSLTSKERAPGPPAVISWLYTKLFFENAFEASIGIVERDWFESKLRLHLNSPNNDSDPSWFALRNTVMAFGCRIHLAKTHTYSEAAEGAMRYFENALSAQFDMLHCSSSVISVKAFALMAYYTEGLGSPHLEYMLVSNAMRLAISKGLHRKPGRSWNLSQQEVLQRNRLFWSIYSLDRQISSRSGRPPAVDDDDISCEPPSPTEHCANFNAVFTTIYVKLTQFYSKVYRRLSNVQGLRKSREDLVNAIAELEKQLETFKSSFEHIIPWDEPVELRLFTQSSVLSSDQMIIIYFLYYGLLLDIHSPLMVPWMVCHTPTTWDSFRVQVEHSCAVVACAAKRAVLASRLIQLNANCPVLLALYAPFRAVLFLFIHILKEPTLETVQSDLILMDVAAGYASRLELATDRKMSYELMRSLGKFARLGVDQAKVTMQEHPSSPQSPHSTNDLNFSAEEETATTCVQPAVSKEMDYQEPIDEANFDTDLETWSALIPLESLDDFNMNLCSL